MGPWRLSAATILASAAMIAWLIVDHKLWERPNSGDERERAALYNAATVATLIIGVAILHIGLPCHRVRSSTEQNRTTVKCGGGKIGHDG
jgi:hypothetical protein